jgi:hypothetical protein
MSMTRSPLSGCFTNQIHIFNHSEFKLMYQTLVQSILLYGAETWSLNTQQANKLLATEMDIWREDLRENQGKKRPKRHH